MKLPKRTRRRDLQGFARIILFGDFTSKEVAKISLCCINYELANRGQEIIIKRSFFERAGSQDIMAGAALLSFVILGYAIGIHDLLGSMIVSAIGFLFIIFGIKKMREFQ